MSARKKRYCQYSRCGKLITRAIGGKDSGKYCNKLCYFAAIDAGEQQFQGALRGLDWQLAAWFCEWDMQRPKASEVLSSQCRFCGNEANGKAYCSKVCASRWHHFSKKPCECVECGASLAGLMYQSRSMCLDCRKRRRRKLNKALKKKWNFCRKARARCKFYGVPYDASVKARLVFERDSFRCQICKAKCLDKFRWVGDMPHLMSPTVDHIVPLSWRKLGHTWDNVQCACWSCNVKKGNRRGGQVRFSFS